MLATTSVLIKTEDGREALSAHRHDLQMRQRHLLILINGARTVGQLQQLLAGWSDLDDLLAGLCDAGMVDVLGTPEPIEVAATPVAEPVAPDAPFDPIAYFNQPLLQDTLVNRAAAVVDDVMPPLMDITLALQTLAVPVGDVDAANEPSALPTPAIETAPAPRQADTTPTELADVLPNVVKVELMRLALKHFGPTVDTVMPLLRACSEDTTSLCDVIAACSHAAAPCAGEHAAARFVDDAMRAMAQRRG